MNKEKHRRFKYSAVLFYCTENVGGIIIYPSFSDGVFAPKVFCVYVSAFFFFVF